jgi:acyl-CoA synthetase (AMP-forming)/AMP-acid ligase II
VTLFSSYFDRRSGLRGGLRLALAAHRMLPGASLNPAKRVEDWARRTPENLALAYREERYSWREYNDRANRYACWFLEQGIRAGDVVALLMDNRPDFLFAVMGLNKIGAASALINTNLAGRALLHAMRAARAKKLLAGSEHLPKLDGVLEELPSLSAQRDLYVQCEGGEGSEGAGGAGRVIDDEVAAASSAERSGSHRPRASEHCCYIYTSGTTGLPKPAVIRNQRILAAGLVFGHLMFQSDGDDVIYVPLPLYHSSAIFLGVGSSLATGAAVALRRKFSASNFSKDVRDFGATGFLYIGEICRYLMNTPVQESERDHRLRVAVGNGLRPDLWEAFQERFGLPVVREFYGATEGIALTINTEGRLGMMGRMLPGQAVLRCNPESGEPIRNAGGFCERVKPGEIGLLVSRISGVLPFDGYVDRQATRKKILQDVFKRGDRYFDSGDLIELHERRWLSFVDRIGDTFRWKGENVSTNEVAEILSGARGLLEANVYGVRVPGTEGRAGMAALKVTADFDLESFGAFVMEQLPGYQRPLFIRLLDGEMRATSTFKHQKVDYREEGFDPSAIRDPLYLLSGGRYLPIDADLFASIGRGELVVGR